MYTNFTNKSWNLSIWNQSHFLSSSSSSSLVVTQFEGINYNVYVILKHYITIPILIVSILCIIVTLITVTRRGLWRTTVTYIVVLAIVDLFTLLSLCILSMDYFIIPALPEGLYTRMYHLIETILDELVDTLLLISNWLTVLIATERYFAVCHPLKVRFIDRRYRRIFIFFVILISILIRLPGFIILGFRTEINLPYILILFRKLYIWIVQIILLLIIPFSILTFVNIRLIQTVRYSSHLIKRRYKRSKKESSVTLNSVKSEVGLLHRIQTLCCIPSNQCHTTKCKLFCCSSLNLKTDRVNSCQLHSLHQQNGSNIIMNKSDLLQITDLSPINSPASLTASQPTGAQVGRSHREEKKITITLVCLIITFFICQGPFVLTTVIMSYSDSQLYRSDTNKIINNTLLFFKMYTDKNTVETQTVIKPFDAVHYINSISIIALALKSDLSFFFYCWFCDRFLFALKKMMHYKCFLRRSGHHHHRHHYGHNYYHNQQQQQHHHHHNHHQHRSHNPECHRQNHQKHILCNSHPQIQKFTKPRHNQEIIELNMPSGGSLLPDYQLPHHHYKYGGEYYQYRIPSDMSSSQQKVLRYKKPAPLPFNLSKHKRIPVINLPMNSKFSWSSPSCSDNSHKCSSPKKRSSSLGPSKGRVKSLNSLKMNM